MPEVTLECFARAAADTGAHGDNDTLPFDIDTRFVFERQDQLADTAYSLFAQLGRDSVTNSRSKISSLSVFSERLLAATGPAGFRIVTKIHPFWNIYFNGLGIAVANALEPKRDKTVFSYRFLKNGGQELFDRNSSWRRFREATLSEATTGTFIVQTDISSFYEHISHHHIKNFVDDFFPEDARIGTQINVLLEKFSGGRSFGIPVGGRCSRVLAELFLSYIDQTMTARGLKWHRYVDDYVLIGGSHAEAYAALSFLSHRLSDYGISLNKAKTITLTAKHYGDYVLAQLGDDDDEAARLKELDLRFDPYSDAPHEDYESLRDTIESLQVQKLLNRELEKSLPDTFLVTQIGRTLRLQKPNAAIQICSTLLNPENLHAFRASWSTIMRGVANLRETEEFEEIASTLDGLLDGIPEHSPHLLQAEASLLHYLRTLRFAKSRDRARFVQKVYESTSFYTVKRACIACWRQWKDRASFTSCRNRWNELGPECQRILWLSSFVFGDQGESLRRQLAPNLEESWRLGIERQGTASYATTYREWCDEAHDRL